jgi:hypothetical protein
MRKRFGDKFWWFSLIQTFGLQGALVLIVSLPVQLTAAGDDVALGWVAWLGVAVWLVGFTVETVGDAQLARFKAKPENEGQVMDTGLWRYTPPPQLLRRLHRVVGAVPRVARRRRLVGHHRADRDEHLPAAGVGRDHAGAHDHQATPRLRRLHRPHLDLLPQATQVAPDHPGAPMSTPAADPELLAAACRFASEAGALTLEWFRKGDLNLEHKVDGTPVTAADKAAEARLRRLIGDFAPEDTILGEEEGHSPGSGERRWIIDPDRRHQGVYPAECRCTRRSWRSRTNTARRWASSSCRHSTNRCLPDGDWDAPSSTSTGSVQPG